MQILNASMKTVPLLKTDPPDKAVLYKQNCMKMNFYINLPSQMAPLKFNTNSAKPEKRKNIPQFVW